MIKRMLTGCIGRVKLKLTGASPEDFLKKLSFAEIPFWGYVKQDELTAFLWIYKRDHRQVIAIGQRTMTEIETLLIHGLAPFLQRMGVRIALFPVILAAVSMTLYLQTHIWYFLSVFSEHHHPHISSINY